jgi:sulfur carrier protein ThiS
VFFLLAQVFFFLKRKSVMKIKVKIVADKVKERSIEVLQDDTYENVLEKLGINPVEVVVLRNGKPVPEDEKVDNKNKGEINITIIRIVSGG